MKYSVAIGLLMAGLASGWSIIDSPKYFKSADLLLLSAQDTLPELRTVEATRSEMAALLTDFCQSFNYEFIDLYGPDEKPRNDDFLTLDDPLKNAGFEVTSYGRGNWTRGPRFISLALEKGDCTCEVKKFYHGNGQQIEKVTERIICNAIDLGNESLKY